MKALSVKQPWANMILNAAKSVDAIIFVTTEVVGISAGGKEFSGTQRLSLGRPKEKKTIETRTWRTEYRGPMLICSSKKIDGRKAQFIANDMRVPGLFMPKIEDICTPVGVALCVADLVDCRPMTEADEKAACCPVYEGAFAWVLENIRPIEPFPVRGRLGFFDVNNGGEAMIKRKPKFRTCGTCAFWDSMTSPRGWGRCANLFDGEFATNRKARQHECAGGWKAKR